MIKINTKNSIKDLLEIFSEDSYLISFIELYNKESKRSLKLNFKEVKEQEEHFMILDEVWSTETLLQSLETNYYYRNINSINGAIEANEYFLLNKKEKFYGINLIDSILRYSCLKKYFSKIKVSKSNFEVLIENPTGCIGNVTDPFLYPKFFYFNEKGEFVLDSVDDHIYVCKDMSLELDFISREDGDEFFLGREDVYSFNTKLYNK